MRHYHAKITRDPHTVYSVSVPEWELSILEFTFDPENVERTGEFTTIDREYPSAEFEYDRLARAYGADPKSGVPHVASVFGAAGAGIRALKRIMLEERDSEGAKQSKAFSAKKGRPKIAAASAGDPLLA